MAGQGGKSRYNKIRVVLKEGSFLSSMVLYRKYRSATWSEVVGQDHIVATLTQAIASGRTSHAYLFTGPRGVGKTSVARILARSLNCTGEPKPCGTCPNCQAALAGNLDIIEIDAASNRGIDEIRDLREKINLAPSFGSHKIYIIDEVHMLTEAAFNALLKTLEEPPAHAVFILATTEAHKLPATIISRTQRFNFHAIDAATIQTHLAAIAAQEGIDIDAAGLVLVAEAAGGSFRDGLSLLDQIAALGSRIGEADVRALLGWGSAADIEALTQAILAGKSIEALDIAERLRADGAQPTQLVNQLIAAARRQLHASVRARTDAAPAVRLLESLITASRSALPQYALEAAIARAQPAPAATAQPQAAVAPPAPTRVEPAPAPTPIVIAQPVAKATPEVARPNPIASAPEPEPDFETRWMKALAELKAKNNSLYALLCSCAARQDGDNLVLGARFSFHRDRLLEPKNQTIIEAAAGRAFGHAMHMRAQLQAEAPVVAQADPAAELVTSALEILGGEVVE